MSIAIKVEIVPPQIKKERILEDLKQEQNIKQDEVIDYTSNTKKENDELNIVKQTFSSNIRIKLELEEQNDLETSYHYGEEQEMADGPETSTEDGGFEEVTVKVEPLSYDSDDAVKPATSLSMDHATPTPVYLIKRNYKKRKRYKKKKDSDDDDDEDYIPPAESPGRKKEKGELNYKPTYRCKKSEGGHTYSEDVTKKVQIVQITEEERQIELKEALSSRSHFTFICVHCAAGFVLEEAYLAHMQVHSPEAGDHECDVCHSRYKSADTLYSHRLRHFRRYRCAVCGALHKDRDTCACHVMTTHSREAFVCKICGKGFRRPQYLKGHMEQYHTKLKSFECPICQRVFYERGRFRCHVRNHNEEVRSLPGNFFCDLCGKELRTKSYLTRHLATMHGSDPSCHLCGKEFKKRDLLMKHVRRVHGPVKDGPGYPCAQCRRVLTTRSMLSRHVQRMHQDRSKNHQCDYCKRFYYTKGEVRAHIMWTHMRAQGGHACACGRVFRTPARLRDHTARAHSNEPPPKNHPCDECGKAFGSKQLLNRHKKTHSDETFPCTECNMMFKTQSYIKTHYKLKHLHMTRAEIRAQSKRAKPVTVEKGMKLKNSVFEKPVYVECGSVNEDLSKEEVYVKEERADLQVPTFETFIDVQRK